MEPVRKRFMDADELDAFQKAKAAERKKYPWRYTKRTVQMLNTYCKEKVLKLNAHGAKIEQKRRAGGW